jgi:hypothetical protein
MKNSLSKPFFTQKKLIVSVSVVLVCYVAVWAGVLISNKINDDQFKNATKQRTKDFNALKPEERAIRQAQAYIRENLPTFKPEQRLILDYLQRKFNLDDNLSASKSPINIYENPVTYPDEIHFLARIAYPEKLVTTPPKSIVDGMNLTNIYGANCDHMTLPANFWATMNQNYEAGGYYLTHNVLALSFMKDNSCTIPQTEADLLSKTLDGMVKMMDDSNTNADLRYEIIAFLGLSGRSDLINGAWLEDVISSQKEDSSWTDDQHPKETDHTTVLALWALLEYYHPNTPYEPLIHRPTQQP